MIRAIYLENDNSLVLVLSNALTGSALNGAGVTATLKDENDVNVPGQSWPQAVTYDNGGTGRYVGGLEDTLQMVRGTTYYAHVSIDGGGGLKGKLKIPLEATERVA